LNTSKANVNKEFSLAPEGLLLKSSAARNYFPALLVANLLLACACVPNRAYAGDDSLNHFSLISVSLSTSVALGLAALSIWQLRRRLRETRARLARTYASVRSMRNRVNGLERLVERFNQGFFAFDFHGRLIPEKKSRATAARFGSLSRDSTVFDLLGLEGDEREHLAKFLRHLENGRITLEEFGAVAPHRLRLEGRVLDVEYAFDLHPAEHKPSHLVAVFIDKTESQAALEESRESQAYVDLVLTIVRDRESFKLFLADARRLMERLKSLMEEPLCADTFRSITMALHTLKGSAGLANFDRVARLSHQLETKLKEAQKRFEQQTSSSHDAAIAVFMNDVQMELALIEAEIEKVYDDFRDLLGHIPVHSSRTSRPHSDETHPRIDLDHYIARQQAAIEDMAGRAGKRVRLELAIVGLPSASERVSDLLASLVHIFRNAIDHGIETPSERRNQGKPEVAVITVEAREISNGETPVIELSISDDGRGIDPERIREVARQRLNAQAIRQIDLESLSDPETLRLIFEDGFSSRDTAGLTSGRGVGLSACRAEVEKLGGTIEVQSELGQGTRLLLRWPKTSLTQTSAAAA
jgi:two-component system chemotaxis sensor kinase CheA